MANDKHKGSLVRIPCMTPQEELDDARGGTTEALQAIRLAMEQELADPTLPAPMAAFFGARLTIINMVLSERRSANEEHAAFCARVGVAIVRAHQLPLFGLRRVK